MHAIATIQVVPVGTKVSYGDVIEDAVAILKERGLKPRVHALGTEVSGHLDHVLNAVRLIHNALHDEGEVRLTTTMTLETRTDIEQETSDSTGPLEHDDDDDVEPTADYVIDPDSDIEGESAGESYAVTAAEHEQANPEPDLEAEEDQGLSVSSDPDALTRRHLHAATEDT